MGGGMRHMNPNMERNLNASAAAGMQFGHGGNVNQRGGVSLRINQQMMQQASKAQQQSQQQQMFAHQQGEQQSYRGQESPGHHMSQYFAMAQPREADPQGMARQYALRNPQTFSPQLGSIGAGLGQDFSQSRRPVMGSVSDLNSPASEPYGVFTGRRSASDGMLGENVLGLRNPNTFGAGDAQSRRYGETSPNTGGLGLGGEVHERIGGVSYDPERRYNEGVFRDLGDNSVRDGLGSGGFNTRRPSVSMQQAAKSFSERDKTERDRAMGLDTWGDPLYSLDIDIIEDRLRDRDRYAENDFSASSNSELFTSAALGGSSNQMLPDESSSEFYDSRAGLSGGLGRGYQQSLNRERDPYLRGLDSRFEGEHLGQGHQSLSGQSGGQGLGQGLQGGLNGALGQGGLGQTGLGAASLFLQQRDDDLLYEKEYALRDRQHQLQTIALQRHHDEDDQRQRLILQNQQIAVQRSGFRSPPQNVFDPKKWI